MPLPDSEARLRHLTTKKAALEKQIAELEGQLMALRTKRVHLDKEIRQETRKEVSRTAKPPQKVTTSPPGTTYACATCGKTFASSNARGDHIRALGHQGAKEPVAKHSPSPPASSRTPGPVRKTQGAKEVSGTVPEVKEQEVLGTGTRSLQVPKKDTAFYSCGTCRERFSNRNTFVVHLKNVHGKSYEAACKIADAVDVHGPFPAHEPTLFELKGVKGRAAITAREPYHRSMRNWDGRFVSGTSHDDYSEDSDAR